MCRVDDTEGAGRTFAIMIDQTVNVSWLVNGSEVFYETKDIQGTQRDYRGVTH